MALLHRLSLAAALMCAGVAAGQTCPAAQFRCPGSFSQSCGSDSGGEITRTVTCNSSGVITSCTISSADGRSCNCGTSGQCTLSPAPAPCDKRCGSQCLDGTDAVCCGTTVYEAGAVCCGGQGYEVGAVCCGSQGYVPGTVCCGELGYESGAVCCTDFACKGGFECCNDGIKACRLPGTSCCKGDPTRACPEGSDCVDTTCCPRLTPQSSAFTSYDPSTGFCCGDQTCAQNGTCQGGAGLCVCANGCAGSCCPSGTVCCPNKGWCASTQLGCPTCTGSNKMCDDGTCAPSGATCCGSGTYCPNGLTCQKCGGPPGSPTMCCVGGSVAAPTSQPPVTPGSGAVASVPFAQANGPAQTTASNGKASVGATGGAYVASGCGCGGSAPEPDAGKRLDGGTGGGSEPMWGCNGGGLAFSWIAIGALLRALRSERRTRR